MVLGTHYNVAGVDCGGVGILLETFVGEDVFDGVEEATVANLASVSVFLDKSVEFSIGEAKTDELEAPPEAIHGNAAGPQFIEILKPVVGLNALEVHVGPDAVLEFRKVNHISARNGLLNVHFLRIFQSFILQGFL